MFSMSFYVLPISGADVVLGVQLLQTLGQILSDYSIPVMQFQHDGHLVTLTGESKGYAAIAIHLIDLLKAGSFQWNPEATHAFNTLKEAMVSLPVLALPDFTKPFDVETYTSSFAIGSVLSQRSHPIDSVTTNIS
ncbi:retrovirus-related pol polyprotein from transposon 297 family protein [Tanacetum coccineum]|uniref:Retrovirus-related pol polyprotein from transposon 297 family protein n=1 Tax=Tanacetum coccineum TaxID=301880 RepID=A0ABQ4X0W3_9ASTR